MPHSLEELKNSLNLNDLKNPYELNSQRKIDVSNKLDNLIKAICNIFDKLFLLEYKNEALLLMALAKLDKSGDIVNKNDVSKEILIEGTDSLQNAFQDLETNQYVTIKKKSSTFHVVKLNDEQFPELKLLKEIVQNHWESPKEKQNKAKKESGLK